MPRRDAAPENGRRAMCWHVSDPDSVFVITAHDLDLGPKAKHALRRRRGRRS